METNVATSGSTIPHKVGLHLDNTKPVTKGGWNVLNAIKPTAVVNVPAPGAPPADIAGILEIEPKCHIFIRPYYPPQAG